MPLLFFAILIAIPVVEIFVFIEIGGEIGALNTIALTFLTAAAGMLLLRIQGISILTQAQERLQAGLSPVREVLSGILLALAGLFLLVPGFVTDAIGFLLFLPPLRNLIADSLASHSRFTRSERQYRGNKDHQYRSETIIEGDYTVVTDPDDIEPGPSKEESPWSKNKD
ncbi:FxsA family protein [Sneathiella glossodoripedis]|uniref:FxsA family protein n=1 Tax=Sneathiella glossodoripedis TaxID=418853 RepID=UPI000470301D|nr:FxsA family protein [Sneathiella glossodoripedis]